MQWQVGKEPGANVGSTCIPLDQPMYPIQRVGWPEQALPHARFARVARSPVMAKCGVRLTIQRAEAPNARGRFGMQNQMGTFLMIDTHSGFAPMDYQDGLGDLYIYKGQRARDRGPGDLPHLTFGEISAIWQYISGNLGSGENVRQATPLRYAACLRRELTQRGDDPRNNTNVRVARDDEVMPTISRKDTAWPQWAWFYWHDDYVSAGRRESLEVCIEKYGVGFELGETPGIGMACHAVIYLTPERIIDPETRPSANTWNLGVGYNPDDEEQAPAYCNPPLRQYEELKGCYRASPASRGDALYWRVMNKVQAAWRAHCEM